MRNHEDIKKNEGERPELDCRASVFWKITGRKYLGIMYLLCYKLDQSYSYSQSAAENTEQL